MDWIRIRIGVHPKMLDPDEMNTDPQPWFGSKAGLSTHIFPMDWKYSRFFSINKYLAFAKEWKVGRKAVLRLDIYVQSYVNKWLSKKKNKSKKSYYNKKLLQYLYVGHQESWNRTNIQLLNF